MKRLTLTLSMTLAIMSFISIRLNASVDLPAVFSDNMVLQQQSEVAFWGTADKNATVRIFTSWNGKSRSVKSDKNGHWKTKIATPKAGGPYTVTISDGKALKLNNILIGEVWVCSGQSNMEMPMRGYRNQPVMGSNEAIATSGNNNIRLFTVQKAKSATPKDDFSGTWMECTPENVYNFSATAYYFGRMLNKVLNVPIGLISSNWGGTRIEAWMSEESIQNFEWVKLPDKNLSSEEISPNAPTALYNAMIKPMTGYGMRGVIWYQGEANRVEYKEYEKLMPGIVADWRTQWGIGDFPFYYAQIAPFNYGNNSNSAFLREAQLKASKVIANSGMACLMDIGERDCIHPAHKEITGNRLAYLALKKTYHIEGICAESPELKEMKIDGPQVLLTFNNAPTGITSYGKGIYNFEIAGKNKKFYPATAYITGSGLTLYSPFVSDPVAVRYAFRDFVTGEVFNVAGLPLSSFRTDDWE